MQQHLQLPAPVLAILLPKLQTLTVCDFLHSLNEETTHLPKNDLKNDVIIQLQHCLLKYI